MSEFHVIIPARYQSTRLPAKPLLNIGDKSMILHVCEKAQQSGAASVTVATDNEEILTEVNRNGYFAVMTSEDHPSGSDRVFEAAELAGLDDDAIIVNVQGDEPFIPATNISLVASLIDTENAMSTLCCPITHAEELYDSNAVKVIFNKNNQAIYFSRSPIPFNRDCPESAIREQQLQEGTYFRHIGIYAYRKSFLKQFIGWEPSGLEKTECLEQLRVIENGYGINISSLNESPPPGVDTESDLHKAREFYLALRENSHE